VLWSIGSHDCPRREQSRTPVIVKVVVGASASLTIPAQPRSKQVYIEWMEAAVLLSTYLSSELILIDTKDFIGQVSFLTYLVLPAKCYHHATTLCDPEGSIVATATFLRT
jgi:hypothetical protein